MGIRTATYKGFKIQTVEPSNYLEPMSYYVFTAEEWAHGAYARSYEWEAITEEEARDFVDCHIAFNSESGDPVAKARYSRMYAQ